MEELEALQNTLLGFTEEEEKPKKKTPKKAKKPPTKKRSSKPRKQSTRKPKTPKKRKLIIDKKKFFDLVHDQYLAHPSNTSGTHHIKIIFNDTVKLRPNGGWPYKRRLAEYLLDFLQDNWEQCAHFVEVKYSPKK